MTPIIFYALFVKLFRAGASFQKRLIDILSTNIGGLLNYSVVLGLNEEMVQNKNVGYSC